MLFKVEVGKGQEQGCAMNEALATITADHCDWIR